MTTIVAAAGGGAWTVGATWIGGVAPTAADDAQLGAGSGPVTINSGAVARSLDCLGYVSTLTHTAGVTLALGDATAGAGNIALRLVAGMTYTLGSATTSAINFVSTSATQQTINTDAKTLGNWTINGVGSNYILASANTIGATATFTLAAGTFDTGNFATSWGLFVISGGAPAKILALGSSAIAITGSAGNTVLDSLTGVTHTANTAVITFAGTVSQINGGSWNGTSLVFATTVNAASILNGSTVANVTYNGPAIRTGSLTIGATTSITGTLTVIGNSAINRVIVQSSVIGTSRMVTVAAFSFTNVDFSDISAQGAAIPWTGTSMGNALGNTNITFDTSVTQTHTASAGGNWSDSTKWTSRVPLPQDNVIVDVNTTGTLTADMPRRGADITFAGFLGTLNATVAGHMYGSITLGVGMTYTGAVGLTLAARSAKTITSNGKQFTNNLTIGGPGGTYTLTDTLSVMAAFTNAASSTFNSADFGITAATMLSSVTGNNPTINLGTSTITLTDTTGAGTWIFSVAGAGVILNASTATFVIANPSATTRRILLSGKTIGTLTYTVAGSTGTLEIVTVALLTGTIGTLNFSDATNARTLLFSPATTTTIATDWNVFGGPGRVVTIGSVGGAMNHTLSKPTGTVSTDYLSVSRSQAVGGAYWYAGANSTDGGNNSGWIFTVPPTAAQLANFFMVFASSPT